MSEREEGIVSSSRWSEVESIKSGPVRNEPLDNSVQLQPIDGIGEERGEGSGGVLHQNAPRENRSHSLPSNHSTPSTQ